MNINQDVLKGKWSEVKGDVQKTWGKLTNDELDETKGDFKALAGLIQKKYGEGKEQFESKLSQLLNRHSNDRNNADVDADVNADEDAAPSSASDRSPRTDSAPKDSTMKQ